MEVVDVAQGTRQVALDEAKRALERVDADFHEDARRVLDVVARRLQQPRRLAQLGQHPARPFGGRSVGKNRLRGQARRQDVGVQVRVALPGAHFLELEQPRAHVVGEHRLLGRFHRPEAGRVDLPQAPREAGKGARVGLDRLPAEVFQQVVVEVDAVERRQGRPRFLQVAQVVVDEVGQRFRGIHGRQKSQTKEPMVQ